jgi:hypothetical protein
VVAWSRVIIQVDCKLLKGLSEPVAALTDVWLIVTIGDRFTCEKRELMALTRSIGDAVSPISRHYAD